MKLFACALLVFAATGCSWFKSASVQIALKNAAQNACNAETKAISSIAGAIANKLNCQSVDAISASITNAIGNANVCKYVPVGLQAQGVIGNMVCPLASAAAVGFMTQAIPAEWNCTATAEAAEVTTIMTQLCESAISI